MDCLFCKIVAGEVPAKLEYEDEEVVGFWDIKPAAPVHLIMVPRKHISGLDKVGEEDVDLLGKIQLAIKMAAEKMGVSDGFQVSLNAGYFQEVPHIHYHLKGGFAKGGVE
ncbi:HIT domain-containing protein [Candidatus Amesbacteria bacterium]|nr:HIT domain-containing protein [Candidatus Amesbacteria bacterium]MBI2587427.1 HIT domain-containing protein [Candidatus Amesbacteria bacterium]